jgi:hypothetical protein
VTQVYDYTGEPIEGDDVLEFRLLYSGRLLGSSKSDTRADLKHSLRREFHPQLRRLWTTNKGLRQWAIAQGNNQVKTQFWKTYTEEEKLQRGLEYLSGNWRMFGYCFLPLVTEGLVLRCSLDILLLRPEEPRFVMNSGDLDAKVKTVFDALRIPGDLKECGGMQVQADEYPFFCLLRDDKLISEIKITADDLLVLPTQRIINPNDAFLVIHVKIQPTSSTYIPHIFR